MLKEIQGRTTDFVVAADGTRMHGLALIYVLRDLPGIARFRIAQESLDLTRVKVVPGSGYSDEVRDSIVRGMRARLGRSVRIEVETVSDIAPEGSGKFR